MFTDSTQALEAIAKGNQAASARAVLKDISRQRRRLSNKDVQIALRWCPGHNGIPGNEKAHVAARLATTDNDTRRADMEDRVRELKCVLQLIDKDRKETATAEDNSNRAGQYAWKLDKALPGKHTLALYGKLQSDGASILAQARTGHNGLNYYLCQRRLRDTADCDCGQGEETVRHVLLKCPKWAEPRKELRQMAGARWGDVSFLLGGWGIKRDWRTGELLDGLMDKWKPNLAVVLATVRFLENWQARHSASRNRGRQGVRTPTSLTD